MPVRPGFHFVNFEGSFVILSKFMYFRTWPVIASVWQMTAVYRPAKCLYT